MEGKLTISKDSRGVVSIELEDVASGIALRSEMALEDFAEAQFGMAYRPCKLMAIGGDIANIGKRKERMKIIAPIPGNTYANRTQLAYEACKAATPEGWECSDYFSSQDSFFTKDGVQYARTSAVRWVEDGE